MHPVRFFARIFCRQPRLLGRTRTLRCASSQSYTGATVRTTQCSFTGLRFYTGVSEDIISVVLKEVASSKEWSDPQKKLLQTAAEHGLNGIPPDCHLFDQLNDKELMDVVSSILKDARKHGEILFKVAYPILVGASSKGNKDAKYSVATMLRDGYGVTEDLGQSAKLYEELAMTAYPYAQLQLGKLYKFGRGVDQNYKTAFTLFKISAMNLVPEAFVYLGSAYQQGQGCEVDVDEAIRCYQRGAELKDPMAYSALARCYASGTGLEKSDEEAFKWNLQSAEAGLDVGLYNTGVHYFSGKGVPVDFSKAAEYFTKAAYIGFDLAQVNLGNMYYSGLGVEKDWDKAKELYKAASATNENAKLLLKELEEEEKNQST